VATQHKRSRRGSFVAAVLLILGAACGFEWWRSQSNFTSLRCGGFVAMTAEGKVCLLYSTASTTPIDTGLHSVRYDKAQKDAVIIRWPMFDFGWTTDPVRNESKLSVVAPLWFLAALCALPTAWWHLRGRRAASIADEMEQRH
jgi:hypothetical protein